MLLGVPPLARPVRPVVPLADRQHRVEMNGDPARKETVAKIEQQLQQEEVAAVREQRQRRHRPVDGPEVLVRRQQIVNAMDGADRPVFASTGVEVVPEAVTAVAGAEAAAAREDSGRGLKMAAMVPITIDIKTTG